ncbi:MAG: glyoxalase [Acidobacteria bacterium]|nr:glyoxalase [Acidobacteriota bacterium]
MIDLVRLHHVSFAVQDCARSKRFFGEILGLPELDRPNFNFPGAWYALGDRQLHIIENAQAGRDAGARISRADHMALEVKDLEPVRQLLSENGIDYVNGENDALGFQQVFCSDPDGHTIEFVRYF